MGGLPAPSPVCARCRKDKPSTAFRNVPVLPGRYCDECAKIMAAPNDPRVVAAYHRRVAKRAAEA